MKLKLIFLQFVYMVVYLAYLVFKLEPGINEKQKKSY